MRQFGAAFSCRMLFGLNGSTGPSVRDERVPRASKLMGEIDDRSVAAVRVFMTKTLDARGEDGCPGPSGRRTRP